MAWKSFKTYFFLSFHHFYKRSPPPFSPAYSAFESTFLITSLPPGKNNLLLSRKTRYLVLARPVSTMLVISRRVGSVAVVQFDKCFSARQTTTRWSEQKPRAAQQTHTHRRWKTVPNTALNLALVCRWSSARVHLDIALGKSCFGLMGNSRDVYDLKISARFEESKSRLALCSQTGCYDNAQSSTLLWKISSGNFASS